MGTRNLSHGICLAYNEQIFNFSKVVLGVSFNGIPVWILMKAQVKCNTVYVPLTSRPENQLDRAYVGKAEPLVDYCTKQELFDQGTRNQTS